VAVAVLDMVIYLAHALNALVDIIQKAELILVNHAVLANGQMQEITFVNVNFLGEFSLNLIDRLS